MPPLPEPSLDALRTRFQRVVETSLAAILARQDDRYGWLDTKIDLRTGRDADPADPVRGRGAVYGWVQGRGLEALARHAAWLSARPHDPATDRLRDATRARLATLMEHTEAVRREHGRLSFLMDEHGRPRRLSEGGPAHRDAANTDGSTLTDLFYAKGLVEAAAVLGRADVLREAVALADRVLADIDAQRLRSDQQAFDPRNPVGDQPGRGSHAPRMLGLAAATRLLRLTGEPRFDALARRFIAHLADRHVCARGDGPLQRGDFWEFVTDTGEPYRTDAGQLWSDPGHAIEAAGFALRHLRLTGEPAGEAPRLWADVAARNFDNGFSPSRIGVCKAFDLVSRRPINPQLPWWSLPEAIRAAAEALSWPLDDAPRGALRAMFHDATRALAEHYLREDRSLMATQCLEPDGTVADAIPAVPDADPGYHTNLCLIEALERLADPRVAAAVA